MVLVHYFLLEGVSFGEMNFWCGFGGVCFDVTATRVFLYANFFGCMHSYCH
jgi:hypothetical protein